jgi:hypothetical protein
MASDSQLEIEHGFEVDQLRLEQLRLEAKAARLEAEAKALHAKLQARRRAPQAKPTEQRQASAKRLAPPPLGRKVKSAATHDQGGDTASAMPPPAQTQPEQAPPSEPIAANADSAAIPPPLVDAPPPRVEPPMATEHQPLAQAHGNPLARLLAATPSYLVSAIVHLVILLVLAVIMLPPPDDLIQQFTVSAAAPEEEDELQDVIIESLEQELESIELEEPILSQAIEVADPGAVELGAVAQDLQAPVSDFQVSMNETNVDAVGALFGSEGQGMADTLTGAGGAEFFGVKAAGRKFVFIVDSSLSMKNGKFEAACEELMYSVSRLSKDQYFYVLFFDQNAAKMTFDGKPQPEKRAVPATGANVNSLGRWVSSIELELQTNPYDCVEFALGLYPDAIYILTDGKFTDKGRTVRYLAKENLFEDPIDGIRPKTIIHTVGFYQRDGETTLKPLAAKHGGTYRFVPPPGDKK